MKGRETSEEGSKSRDREMKEVWKVGRRGEIVNKKRRRGKEGAGEERR